ncbi:MAG: hypothetical protein JU82_00320 [Sulfuricurvum sp. MLSB]|uniref:hypothetical protein n=1 Tax=unclassified Sulfuricurvum TaxID=2632390 RepID=UPI0005060CB0|nr:MULTISPECIES: hypothetical protein [unclassified Sulfuricurvum]KFN40859.1 MAG: hypothetical protein JU82_00320 [Sulfuricurvum sp. MLSB]
MNDVSKLFNLLVQCNDISDNDLEIVSKELENSTEILAEYSITYEKHAEGIYIDLSIQPLHIYKTKKDCLLHYADQTSDKPIIILQDQIYFQDGHADENLFFENLIFASKIQKLLIEKEIASYHDILHEKFIFLSEKRGKIEVGYKDKSLDFYERNHELKELYHKLSIKCQENEYLSFFRDNMIEKVQDCKDINYRFITALENLAKIVEKANREFELYKNKFSFEEFQSKLDEEKDKYFKTLQDSLSEFLSKVNSLPIQFGVYIYLLFRFEKEPYPLLIASGIIFVWSLFSFFTISTMKKGISDLKVRFDHVFQLISEKSGIDKEVLVKEQDGVNGRVRSILKLTSIYQSVVIVFTVGFILMAIYLIDLASPHFFEVLIHPIRAFCSGINL